MICSATSPRRARELRLLGPHNADNAVAAAAVAAGARGRRTTRIRAGLRELSRASRTGSSASPRSDGVLYVNDSKATNVAAAAAALRSFDGGVRAILGGSLKGGDFDGLAEPVAERCAACYLIGEAAERIERELEPARDAGVELRRCDDLADAVAAAAADASPGEVVLLSPACASFDAYRDFEQRGEHFRALVEELPSDEAEGRSAPAHRRSSTRLLLTATLCLLAFGVVMVFSASSTTSLLGESGDSAYYLKRTLIFGALGLLVMRLLAGAGSRRCGRSRRCCSPARSSCARRDAPGRRGRGRTARALDRRPGPFQIQPSELAEAGADPVRRPPARHAARDRHGRRRHAGAVADGGRRRRAR